MNKQTKKTKLFGEFPPVPTQEWEEKIKADLKGADYEKKLLWKTDEGFTVKPYYRQEELNGLDYLNSLPGEAPFTRGVRAGGNDWIIRQDVCLENIEEANSIAVEAIRRGANSLGFCAKEITSHKQMSRLLENIDLATTGINFLASRSYPLTLELLVYEGEKRKLKGEEITGSINFDPNSYCLLHGDYYKTRESNIEEALYLLQTASKKLPKIRVITVNGGAFSNGGATAVQELAFALASAHDYVSELTGKGISADLIIPRILFSFGTGPNYFMEIAKLRAARLLWATIVSQYHPKSDESLKMYIHSTTASWNKTIYDPYVNLLRTTTESMSAILGNADSVSVLPFDISYKDSDEFSMRIARNQQLILKNEAYLDKVTDPASGAYYIENLTHSIAVHAWEKFRWVENNGGFAECIKKGMIQDEISESCRKKEMDIAQRKTVIIGTNQYPNISEKMLGQITKAASPGQEEQTPYKVIRPFRGAEAFETLRLLTERFVEAGNKRPAVYLLQFGNLAMRKARAAFSTNFFGCAGFEIIDEPGNENMEDEIRKVKNASPQIVVLCSSDEEYATQAVSYTEKIKSADPAIKVVVAGFPKEITESLKSAGVDDFIHIKSNVTDTLKKFQGQLGIIKA
jgi:methylmalonyl-CoA mutase